MGSNPLILLKTAELFSSCGNDDLEAIASYGGYSFWDDGEMVFAAGDPSDRLYIVHAGEIVIRKNDDEGHPVDIARFLPGDCFGELDMFTRAPRNASAFADGRVSLFTFPGDERGFWDLKDIDPGVSARLLHSFMVRISARTRGVNALVKENSPLVQDLKKQVYMDKLTGLNNRTCFDEVLEKIVSAQERVGLLMYKPDNFKAINDRHGHDAGDKVLRLVADRLREFVPDSDMLFRYMGNENAVILPGAGRNELSGLAGRVGSLLRTLDLGVALNGDDMKLSVSFGLALYPDHAGDAKSLADAAHPLTLEGRRRGGNLTLYPEDSESL